MVWDRLKTILGRVCDGPGFAKAGYVTTNIVGRPGKAVFERYFSNFPDVYRMAINGDQRFTAIADVMARQVGPVSSLLDVACHEGYGLEIIAKRLDIPKVEGWDISEVALERARCRLLDMTATFAPFDLRLLHSERMHRAPPAGSWDVVLVCECLYYLGLHWRVDACRVRSKERLIRTLQRRARKAVLFQHFGRDVRHSIGAVLERCGARKVGNEWGIYVLPGLALA